MGQWAVSRPLESKSPQCPIVMVVDAHMRAAAGGLTSGVGITQVMIGPAVGVRGIMVRRALVTMSRSSVSDLVEATIGKSTSGAQDAQVRIDTAIGMRHPMVG